VFAGLALRVDLELTRVGKAQKRRRGCAANWPAGLLLPLLAGWLAGCWWSSGLVITSSLFHHEVWGSEVDVLSTGQTEDNDWSGLVLAIMSPSSSGT
jgi:hypothetical protein